uniref:Uncharacterized protein n=1 Tax=Bicosoecida sp. CB-2014 TaxID=1486930 RepID=A0A7S1GEU7_9STRA|mmetsp:Transcript_85/g.308  ORF Transcript_85/g.308 Transcript_85/m.308 type:complete len:360 (+) Transcript_85:28-1107(+)
MPHALPLLAVAAFLAALASPAAASKLVFTNNSQLIGPGLSAAVGIFDTSTKSVEMVFADGVTGLNNRYSYVSGAAVCGEFYYALYASPAMGAAGVARVALNDKKGNISYTATDGVPHALACDPTDATHQSLLVMMSQKAAPTAGDNLLTFVLYRANTFTSSMTKVAAFPSAAVAAYDGFDSIFSFTEDGGELWANFPDSYNPLPKGGDLLIMNTKTGAVRGPFNYDYGLFGGNDYTYWTHPPAAAGGGASSFVGVTGSEAESGANSFYFSQLAISGKSVTVTRGADVSDWFWTIGVPVKVCDGVGFAVRPAQHNPDDDDGSYKTQQFTAFDAATGEVKAQFNLDAIAPNTNAAAWACMA